MTTKGQLFSYLERGMSVIPIHNTKHPTGCSCEDETCNSKGKHPRTIHGVKDASTNPDQVIAWLEEFPGCNWAVATGPSSGVAVCDIDPRHGGDFSLESLVKKYTKSEKLPPTPVSQTGGQGWHYWFIYPKNTIKRLKNRSIAPGVDIKVEGGYVLVPPSETSYSYHWIKDLETPLAEMPGWMVDLASKGHEEYKLDEQGQIPRGSRNNYLTSIGGTMRRRGMTFESIHEALKVECELRCGGYGPEKYDEVEYVANSVCKYEPDDPFLSEYEDDLDIDVRMNAATSEETTLGYIISGLDQSGTLVAEACSVLRPDHMLLQAHSMIYKVIFDLWSQGVTITVDTTQQALESKGDWNKKGVTAKDLLRISEAGRSILYPQDLRFHVSRILQAYMHRESARIFDEAKRMSKRQDGEAEQLIAQVSSRLMRLLDTGSEKMIFTVQESMDELTDMLNKAKAGELTLNEPTGWKDIDDVLLGLVRGGVSIIAGRPGHGKLLADDELVLTPEGWVRNGDLRPEDFVIGANGKPTKVIETFPHQNHQTVIVELNDNTKIKTSWDHLWETSNRNERTAGKSSVKTTKEIFETLTCKGGTHLNHHLPVLAPVQFSEKELPIDPYVFGLWLGDGDSNGGRITSGDDFCFDEIIRRGYTVGSNTNYCRCPMRTVYGLAASLRELGLLKNKRVPDLYLYSSTKQRLDLLRGLMDSDGTYNPASRQTSFCTTLPALRDAVVEIVQSFGGRATYSKKRPKYVYNEEIRFGKTAWIINISFPDNTNPFLLPRKANIYRPVKHFRVKKIKAVYEGEIENATCIRIEDPRHLYVTRGYTLTHNTAFALQLNYQMNRRWQESSENACSIIFSAEMTKKQLMLREVAREAQVDSKRIRNWHISGEEESRIWEVRDEINKNMTYYIDETPSPTGQYMLAKALAINAICPVRLVIFDFLELVGNDTSMRPDQKVLYLEEALKRLKELAKRLNCVVVVLSQLKRDVETRATRDQKPSPRSSDLRWCVTEDTNIRLSNGKNKKAKDLEAGDRVLTLNSDWKFIESKPIVVFEAAKQPVYSIRTRTNKNLRVSGNHPILTENGYINAKELREGDFLACSRELPSDHNWMNENKIDESLFLGYLIGDGTYLHNRSVEFANSDEDVLNRAEAIGKKLFNRKPRKSENGYPNNYRLSFTGPGKGPGSSPAIEWIKKIGIHGEGSYDKRIPEFVKDSWDVPALIAGLIQTDGCIKRNGKGWSVDFSTVSENLVKDVQDIMLRLGVISYVNKEKNVYRLVVSSYEFVTSLLRKMSHHLVGKKLETAQAALMEYKETMRSNLDLLPKNATKELIKFQKDNNISWKKVKYRACRENTRIGRKRAQKIMPGIIDKWAFSDLFWDEVKSVHVEDSEVLYDIQVPDTNNFLAEDIVTHNTGMAEQLAEQIIMVHSPHKFWGAGIRVCYPTEPNPYDYVVSVTKNRDGQIADIPMTWIPEFGLFQNGNGAPRYRDDVVHQDHISEGEEMPWD